jgi:glucose-6-phosphate-specific signal transduction histidine kinase
MLPHRLTRSGKKVLCHSAREPHSAAGGHGIDGMRERAASVGGELTAGPLPEGGFQVTATLPVPALGESS